MRLFGRFALPFDSGIRLVVLPALVAAMLAGCGGDDAGPAQVNGPEPMVVPDGTFTVTAQEIFKTCDQPNTWNTDFEITFDGATFTMGDDWTGTWDAIAGLARGESKRESVVLRECTVTTWTAVEVSFSSEDECAGNIKFRRSVNGECNTTCTVTWAVTAVRK